MQGLSPPTAKSLSSVFHIPIASPTNAASSTNVSTPKSTHRPHGFKKIQLISPSTPTSPPNTGKLGKLLKTEKLMTKGGLPFQTSSPKISIFDTAPLSKKSSIPMVQKSVVIDPSLDNLETKRARKFTMDTERKKNKCSASQSSIQEINGIESNITKPRKPSEKATPKNKGNSIGSKRMLTETEKLKPSASTGDFMKPMTARDTLQSNKPRMQFLMPKDVAKHFDFSRPKEKIPLNYHLKGLAVNPNPIGLKNHVPLTTRSHSNKEPVHLVKGAGANISATLVTEINASGNSLMHAALKPLSVSHGVEKMEESVTLNVPTAGPTENDASRSNIRKPSYILSKELEIKYGIKLDYSSSSSVTSDEDEEESEEIKDDINQLGPQPGNDKKLQRIFKEGSFARNKGGYLVKNHERSSSVEDTNQEVMQESGIKKKEEDVFSSQSKEFFHFNESHLKFEDFTSLYKHKGIGLKPTNKKKKPWRATSKQTQEEYKPMMARFHGGSQFVQPKFMKHMGSMCYTELWPKHFSVRMEKIMLKEEQEKSNELAKNLGKKESAVKKEEAPKQEARKEEVQKSFQRKFRGTLQSWGNGPLPTESSGLLTTKRKSDGSISARAKQS